MGDSTRIGRGLALLAAAGLALAACEPTDQSADGGDTASDQDTAGAVSSQDVIAMERAVWEELSQGNMEAFGEQLADDVVLIGGEGVLSKQEVMSRLEGATMESYELGDFEVMQPGSDVAMVVYRYSETFQPSEADSMISVSGWATSVWENRDGTWQVVLHQSSATPPGGEGASGGE